ncbi:hypothetical protein HYE68_002621 [Fusarium pseudograminearum]|nr:hypothetical protein HYE68_002621 [Fusarium pseudograminearum]
MSASAVIFDLAVKGLTGVVHIVTLVEKARGYVLEWFKKKGEEQKGNDDDDDDDADVELGHVGIPELTRRHEELAAGTVSNPETEGILCLDGPGHLSHRQHHIILLRRHQHLFLDPREGLPSPCRRVRPTRWRENHVKNSRPTSVSILRTMHPLYSHTLFSQQSSSYVRRIFLGLPVVTEYNFEVGMGSTVVAGCNLDRTIELSILSGSS